MGRLCARPDGQLSIGILDGYGGVLLDGKMRVSLVEKSVLKNLICFGKPFLDVSELQGHELVNVSFLAVFVNARLWSHERFFGIGDGCQDFIVHID